MLVCLIYEVWSSIPATVLIGDTCQITRDKFGNTANRSKAEKTRTPTSKRSVPVSMCTSDQKCPYFICLSEVGT